MSKKNIVFIVNLDEQLKKNRNAPYKFSIDSWKKYCDKYGCELFVLEDRIYDEDYMNANWHKMFAIPLLENNDVDFDNILIVDSDTIVHPDSPNIFELSDGNICAVHNTGNYDWVIRSMENYSHELFNGFMFPLDEYVNTGLLLINKSHSSFFREVQEFYFDNVEKIMGIQQKYGVGTDQPVFNFLLHLNKVPLKLLPFEWNMQELPLLEILDTQMTFTKFGWVYHFNGIHPKHVLNEGDTRSSVYQWMEYVYNKLYPSTSNM
jgi:hypothetical protein